MGAWGSVPFDNDAAADFLTALEASPMRGLLPQFDLGMSSPQLNHKGKKRTAKIEELVGLGISCSHEYLDLNRARTTPLIGTILGRRNRTEIDRRQSNLVDKNSSKPASAQ